MTTNPKPSINWMVVDSKFEMFQKHILAAGMKGVRFKPISSEDTNDCVTDISCFSRSLHRTGSQNRNYLHI